MAELLGQRDENRKKVRETESGSLAMSKSECLSALSVRVAQLRSRRAKSKSKLRAAGRWEPKWIVVLTATHKTHTLSEIMTCGGRTDPHQWFLQD